MTQTNIKEALIKDLIYFTNEGSSKMLRPIQRIWKIDMAK